MLDAEVEMDGKGKWIVKVPQQHLVHNHTISANIYQHYPKVKKVVDPVLRRTLKGLFVEK